MDPPTLPDDLCSSGFARLVLLACHWLRADDPSLRRDGSGGDEGESIGKVDCGEVFKGMEVVESAGIADGVVALGCTEIWVWCHRLPEEVEDRVLGADCARMRCVGLVTLEYNDEGTGGSCRPWGRRFTVPRMAGCQ